MLDGLLKDIGDIKIFFPKIHTEEEEEEEQKVMLFYLPQHSNTPLYQYLVANNKNDLQMYSASTKTPFVKDVDYIVFRQFFTVFVAFSNNLCNIKVDNVFSNKAHVQGILDVCFRKFKTLRLFEFELAIRWMLEGKFHNFPLEEQTFGQYQNLNTNLVKILRAYQKYKFEHHFPAKIEQLISKERQALKPPKPKDEWLDIMLLEYDFTKSMKNLRLVTYHSYCFDKIYITLYKNKKIRESVIVKLYELARKQKINDFNSRIILKREQARGKHRALAKVALFELVSKKDAFIRNDLIEISYNGGVESKFMNRKHPKYKEVMFELKPIIRRVFTISFYLHYIKKGYTKEEFKKLLLDFIEKKTPNFDIVKDMEYVTEKHPQAITVSKKRDVKSNRITTNEVIKSIVQSYQHYLKHGKQSIKQYQYIIQPFIHPDYHKTVTLFDMLNKVCDFSKLSSYKLFLKAKEEFVQQYAHNHGRSKSSDSLADLQHKNNYMVLIKLDKQIRAEAIDNSLDVESYYISMIKARDPKILQQIAIVKNTIESICCDAFFALQKKNSVTTDILNSELKMYFNNLPLNKVEIEISI